MDADSGLTAMALVKALAKNLTEKGVITAGEWVAVVDDAIAKASELPNAGEVVAVLRTVRQSP